MEEKRHHYPSERNIYDIEGVTKAYGAFCRAVNVLARQNRSVRWSFKSRPKDYACLVQMIQLIPSYGNDTVMVSEYKVSKDGHKKRLVYQSPDYEKIEQKILREVKKSKELTCLFGSILGVVNIVKTFEKEDKNYIKDGIINGLNQLKDNDKSFIPNLLTVPDIRKKLEVSVQENSTKINQAIRRNDYAYIIRLWNDGVGISERDILALDIGGVGINHIDLLMKKPKGEGVVYMNDDPLEIAEFVKHFLGKCALHENSERFFLSVLLNKTHILDLSKVSSKYIGWQDILNYNDSVQLCNPSTRVLQNIAKVMQCNTRITECVVPEEEIANNDYNSRLIQQINTRIVKNITCNNAKVLNTTFTSLLPTLRILYNITSNCGLNIDVFGVLLEKHDIYQQSLRSISSLRCLPEASFSLYRTGFLYEVMNRNVARPKKKEENTEVVAKKYGEKILEQRAMEKAKDDGMSR